MLILSLEIPMISKEWFNKASKLSKSSKSYDSKAILKWGVPRVKFFLIVSLLKPLIS